MAIGVAMHACADAECIFDGTDDVVMAVAFGVRRQDVCIAQCCLESLDGRDRFRNRHVFELKYELTDIIIASRYQYLRMYTHPKIVLPV